VVEFEREGMTCKGLIFLMNGIVGIVSGWHYGDGKYTVSSSVWFDFAMKTARKIGETDSIRNVTITTRAKEIAKAYFAQPTFKVGDRVKVVRKGSVSCGHDVGSIGEITSIDEDTGNPRVKCGHLSLWHSLDSLEPAPAPTLTGTYEERQKQWLEYHGLKVGSKVKVVRKFKEDEDGCDCMESSEKDDAVGSVFTVIEIRETYIVVSRLKDNCFPYSALEPA
jgi:transcription antitermination factor NusG